MNLPVLGAWLHDIGKFAQRARENHSPLEHEYCKQDGNGHYTHQHVLYTDYFIENLLPLPDELKPHASLLASLAASHHRAEGKAREHQAIQWADQLSSGMDRTKSADKGNFIAARLKSVFARVRLDDRGIAQDARIPEYELLPLGAENAIFPVANPSPEHDYQSLWRAFIKELQNLPCDCGPAAWQASLISLLERYCWCIPSATYYSLPDISLYDHSATTAAITQAILGCPPDQEKFLLYGGDVSGIQAFIFGREESAAKGAFKFLRSRSFLVQAITRSVWLALLDRLKLEHAAKIMDAGGRFVLLLPDTPPVRKQLDQLELEAEKWLLDNFQGTVRLNSGRLPLAPADLHKDIFASKFDEFNEVLENAKLHPFSHACAAGLLPVTSASSADYSNGECAFCHSRPGTGTEGGEPICDQCRKLLRLGAQLPKAAFITFTRSREKDEHTFTNLLLDGLSLQLFEKRPEPRQCRGALEILSIKGEAIFTMAPVAGHTPVISASDISRWQSEGRLSQKDGECLFMGESCKPGDLKTFAMLAQEAAIPPAVQDGVWQCMPCLAVCKADVDNLGLIFSMGFGEQFSISSYAMLARMLNHFFAGFLMDLIRRHFPDIYVVFAGGDDVFVIGPWTTTIAFGLEMEKFFRKFCGYNPAVTISAGMPLVKSGLPMRAMREEAEEWLEASKGFREDKVDKNAVTLFNISSHWPEADKLLDTGRWLASICETGAISRAFLRRLLGYSRQCREFYKGRKLAKNGLYISHLEYDIARNLKDSSGQASGARQRIRELAQDKDIFAKAEMGIAWAIYRTRIS